MSKQLFIFRSDWSNFVILRQTTSITLYTVLNEKAKLDKHPDYEKKVKGFYIYAFLFRRHSWVLHLTNLLLMDTVSVVLDFITV